MSITNPGTNSDGAPARPSPADAASLVGGVLGLTVRAVRGVRERVEGAPALPADAVAPLVDIPIGLAVGAAQVAGRATHAAMGVARPIAAVALRPPILPRRFWPQTTLDTLADRGRIARGEAERNVAAMADSVVPVVVGAILDRIDLAGITSQVVDDIDLPEIIRESSGAMASESVIGVRMQGIEADEKVSRIVDRLLLRRGERDTTSPSDGSGR